jgi:hypothetical protein
MKIPKNQHKRVDSDNQINVSSLIDTLDDTSIPDYFGGHCKTERV